MEPFNDIEIIYDHWGSTTGTQAQKYWGAATVNNEVQFFREMATDNNKPPYLDILLLPNRGQSIL